MGRKPTNNREKLIETALELIWLESYNAVSVDDICKKAGVQKGSFYHYFPSKAHLALETMDDCVQQHIAEYEEMFSADTPPLERFRKMVKFITQQQKEVSAQLGRVCGCPFATLGSELAAQDEGIAHKVTDICSQKTVYYQRTLQDLVEAGIIDKNTDTQAKADEIFAFIVGQLIMARIKNDLKYLEENLEKALFDLIGVSQQHYGSEKLRA
ncbi:MAG: TetR family transcriptional regulator [Micavibrio sp.]|nr:TetR family transcriptional regulator [Micavibrio sp.]|tara:strand:+ start:265 stop:900 length:636 start_codon:yes stop_codon:yes gene_type:complete